MDGGRVRRLNAATGNKIKAIISHTVRAVAMMSASGPLMQTFLSVVGFESDLIYIHSTLLQAANFITIMLASGWANRGCPIRRSAATAIPMALLFLVYVPVAVTGSAGIEAYILIVATGVVQQVTVGLYTVCEYKVPYYIYKTDEYGMVLSVCGIVSSLLTLGTGAAISYLTEIFDYGVIMVVAFSASAVLMGIAFIATFTEKNLLGENRPGEEARPGRSGPSIITLLRLPVFSLLIPANLLRGFAAGIIGVLATVAIDLGHSVALTTAMVSAGSAAGLIACGFFAISAKRIPPGIQLIVGCVIVGLLPALLIPDGTVFLVIYTAISIGRTLIDYSVPAMLIKVVPVEIAGSYHAWRMALQHGGSLIATSVASLLPIPWLLSLSAVFSLLSSLAFFAVCKRYTAI